MCKEAERRVEPLVKICLEWGKSGVVPEKLIMSYDDKSNNVGLAWGKAVCMHRDWCMSINAWDPDMTTFANTVAHEIGHNLGMEHDHEPNHKAKGCDKQGIMSYGGNWIKWSTCSRDDFTNHYRTMLKKNSFWCLPEAPSACDSDSFVGNHVWV